MRDILVIQAARFGDLVQTRRLILSLLRQGNVHLAIDKSLLALARIVYPEAILHGLAFHGSSGIAAIDANSKDIADLKRVGFDAVFNCNFSPLTSALIRIFPSDTVYGYRAARDSLGGLLRSAWTRFGFRLSAMRQATPLNLVDFWGNFAPECIPPALVNPPARGGRGVGIALAGRMERRSLPVHTLARLTEIAWKALDRPMIRLLGTQNEIPRARKLLRLLPPAMEPFIENLCGRTDWAALARAIKDLELLLTPDTGIMHLAAFMGVPVVAFFLSSAWCHETGPYGAGHRIFQAAPGCAPCLESAPCPNNVRCASGFEHPLFARAFAQMLMDKHVSDLPPDIQLWHSGLDELGLRLTLLAGEDRFAVIRAKIRDITEAYLGLAQNTVEDTGLLERLLPYSEWMLPPGRYC